MKRPLSATTRSSQAATLLALAFSAFVSIACPAASHSNPGGSAPVGQQRQPSEILSAAAAKGSELLAALKDYTYYAETTIEMVSGADVVTGKHYRFSQISYDSDGNRRDKLFEEKSTLPKDVHIGTNTVKNLTRVYYFVLSPVVLSEYEFNYVGRERIDELNTYVFDVKPKVKMPNPDKSADRYLKGRIWIDDQDIQVVKVSGQALPEQSAHRTPKFETYCQNYGNFWFPAYTSADDIVRVGGRMSRVIVNVRYTSYSQVKR